MNQDKKGVKLKALFISEDEESFLCIRQFFCNSLHTGEFLDDKNYQGRRFKLIKEEDNEQRKQPLQE